MLNSDFTAYIEAVSATYRAKKKSEVKEREKQSHSITSHARVETAT